VIATLVAVIFYTKIEEHKAAVQTAEEDLRKYVASDETGRANDYIRDGKTAFENMEIRIRTLENELNGPTGSIRQIAGLEYNIQEKINAYNVELAAREQAQRDLATEQRAHQATRAMMQRELDQRETQIVRQTQELATIQSRLDALIADGNTSSEQVLAQLNEQLRDKQTEIAGLQEEIVDLQNAYAQLLPQIPRPLEPNTTTPDGQVASVMENGRDLFISLGRRNGIVLGMEFEIFDPNPIIRLNDVGAARGKATVEVYALDSDSATCRVVRRETGAQIVMGDPIVNLGYHPNMEIAMFAYGYFDIEHDGGPNDIGRIQAQIIGSGAELLEMTLNAEGVPVITPDLDYIVLGEKPVLPDPPPPGTFDPEVIEAYQAKVTEYQTYFSILDAATVYRIPVLNQDRLLDLTGYYER